MPHVTRSADGHAVLLERRHRFVRRVGHGVFVVALFGGLLPVAAVELFDPRPYYRPFPLGLLAGVLFALRPLAADQPRWLARGGYGLALLAAAALVALPTHPLKTFVRDVARIEPGMTPAEVDAVMAAHGRGAGGEGLQLFADRTSYEPSGARRSVHGYALVVWEGGRVASVELDLD